MRHRTVRSRIRRRVDGRTDREPLVRLGLRGLARLPPRHRDHLHGDAVRPEAEVTKVTVTCKVKGSKKVTCTVKQPKPAQSRKLSWSLGRDGHTVSHGLTTPGRLQHVLNHLTPGHYLLHVAARTTSSSTAARSARGKASGRRASAPTTGCAAGSASRSTSTVAVDSAQRHSLQKTDLAFARLVCFHRCPRREQGNDERTPSPKRTRAYGRGAA